MYIYLHNFCTELVKNLSKVSKLHHAIKRDKKEELTFFFLFSLEGMITCVKCQRDEAQRVVIVCDG